MVVVRERAVVVVVIGTGAIVRVVTVDVVVSVPGSTVRLGDVVVAGGSSRRVVVVVGTTVVVATTTVVFAVVVVVTVVVVVALVVVVAVVVAKVVVVSTTSQNPHVASQMPFCEQVGQNNVSQELA